MPDPSNVVASDAALWSLEDLRRIRDQVDQLMTEYSDAPRLPGAASSSSPDEISNTTEGEARADPNDSPPSS